MQAPLYERGRDAQCFKHVILMIYKWSHPLVLSDFFEKTTHNAASPFLRFDFYAKRGAGRQNKGCF